MWKSIITNYHHFVFLLFAANRAFLSVRGIVLNAASASSRVNCECLIMEIANSPLQIEQCQPSADRLIGAVPQAGQNIISCEAVEVVSVFRYDNQMTYDSVCIAISS